MTLRAVPRLRTIMLSKAHSDSWRLGDGELFAVRKYDNQLYGISPSYLAKMANTAGEQR